MYIKTFKQKKIKCPQERNKETGEKNINRNRKKRPPRCREIFNGFFFVYTKINIYKIKYT